MPRQEASTLVREFIERMAGDILEDRYRPQLAELIRGHAGVYALYRGEDLYYVGLAVDLMKRVDQHLKDHHAGAWDRFSVYLTSRDEHIKSLESLLLRVFQPPGNRNAGKLPGANDRKRALEKAMRQHDADRRAKALNETRKRSAATTATQRKPPKRKAASAGTSVSGFAGLIPAAIPLRAEYKGRRFQATARKNGTVLYAGNEYSSLSASASAITGSATNGWLFWTCRTTDGDWRPMNDLR